MSGLEERAKALFDAMPHNNIRKRPGEAPVQVIPDWDLQPENIKDVFRRKAKDESEGNL